MALNIAMPKKIDRFVIFKIIKWSILPVSLVPIILNILVLVSSASHRSDYEANTYFIRFDLQKADLSKIIKGVNSTVLESLAANHGIRESYSYGLLNDCSGLFIDNDYKIKDCSKARPNNGLPLNERLREKFQSSIKDQYPEAYLDLPESFTDALKQANKNYLAITGLSILSLTLSCFATITYFISLFVVSNLFIFGVTTSLVSSVSLLVVAIIAVSTNVRVLNSFQDIDKSFDATLGNGSIYVCNWLAAAFQCLIVVMLFTLFSIRTVTVHRGVKFKFEDVLNKTNTTGTDGPQVIYFDDEEWTDRSARI